MIYDLDLDRAVDCSDVAAEIVGVKREDMLLPWQDELSRYTCTRMTATTSPGPIEAARQPANRWTSSTG